MITSEEFEQELFEALVHLYDASYEPPASLFALLGCDPSRDGALLAVQTAIIRAIKGLKPPPVTPQGARTEQIYDLLHSRYVLKLTREETAWRLHMSVSSVKRLQRRAVHALTRVLWERGHAREGPEVEWIEGGQQQKETPGTQDPDWHSQAKRELTHLQERAPHRASDVAQVITGVLELTNVLARKHGVGVEVGWVQPDLYAPIHPNVLRQLLITSVGQLARPMQAGQITIYAGVEDGNVRITLTGPVANETAFLESDLSHNMLAPHAVSVEAHVDGGHAFLWLEVPCAGRITVLVVDDNPDIVHFYRRSTEGTSYRIVQAMEGQDLFAAVEATAPDIIVLDIMLPDVDGWELLMHLHEHPTTRSVPVIVCSVIREEDLALSLGATLYLSKPVQPRQFIEALNRVLA